MEPHPAGIRVEFRSRNLRIRPFKYLIPGINRIDDARSTLDEQLTLLKDVLPSLSISDVDLGEVSRRLHNMGRHLIMGVFGIQPAVINDVQNFWRRAVPTWRNSRYVPLVEVVGDPAYMLPLEYMPLFDIAGPDHIEGRREFVDQCRSFVGFRCMVRRTVLPFSVSRNTLLRRSVNGRIPLRYFHHDGLRGARREYEWLVSSAGHCIDIEGPFPCENGPGPTLAEQIFDPTLLLTGGCRNLPDQIQHFACHCYTRINSPPHRYEIQLRGGNTDVQVTLGEIGNDLVRFAADRRPRAVDMPLIIMNACGSSTIKASNTLSFPMLFLENGNRGFIGSDVAIPDDVAFEFSRSFYENLLLRKNPVGVAIHNARENMLLRFGNPLGVAYAVYANPELQIESVIPSSPVTVPTSLCQRVSKLSW